MANTTCWLRCGPPQVGEGEGESGDDIAAAGGVEGGVRVVATDKDLTGIWVGLSGIFGEAAGAGGHHGDVPVGDPLLGG